MATSIDETLKAIALMAKIAIDEHDAAALRSDDLKAECDKLGLSTALAIYISLQYVDPHSSKLKELFTSLYEKYRYDRLGLSKEEYYEFLRKSSGNKAVMEEQWKKLFDRTIADKVVEFGQPIFGIIYWIHYHQLKSLFNGV